jgi:hypothetical protein
MKNYVASNAATGCWWNGKAFSDEGTLAVITAPELAVLRATYDNVIAAEVVSLPTITEDEFERQKAEKQANVSPWEYVKDEYRKDPTPYKT